MVGHRAGPRSCPAPGNRPAHRRGPLGHQSRLSTGGTGPRGETGRHGEAGTGLVSSLAGVTVFLVFLLLAVQLIVNLYARSAVSAAGYDAARAVAARPVDHGDPEAVDAARRRAEAGLRDLLGELGDGADLRWRIDPATVRLRVVVDAPGIVPSHLVGGPGLRRIDRTFVVRIEQPR